MESLIWGRAEQVFEFQTEPIPSILVSVYNYYKKVFCSGLVTIPLCCSHAHFLEVLPPPTITKVQPCSWYRIF